MRGILLRIVGGFSATLACGSLLVGIFTPLAVAPIVDATSVDTVASKQSSTKSSGTDPTKDKSKNTQRETKPAQEAATQTTATPVVRQPDTVVAPAPAPSSNRISIPSIGLDSAYTDVGLTSAGAIDVPATVVGRWNGSAAPGAPGAGFYDGHTPGIFSGLAGLSSGANITITGADDTSYIYRVVHREIIALSNVDMRSVLSVYGGASEGVNLMTCAGTYVPSLGTYDARLIIYAVRI